MTTHVRVSRARHLLEMSNADIAGLVLGSGALATGVHSINKAMLRRSLREVGYVDHPDNPNLMVHVKTGRTYSMGWGHPHD